MRNGYKKNNHLEKLTSDLKEFAELLQQSTQKQQASFIVDFYNFQQSLEQPQQQKADAVEKLYHFHK
ncbi:MAG: hypothetical protein EBT55_00495 [Proteobacteria bacterium]|nr:hypothetical protein [Pseudomonadota bacterium]